MLTVEREQVLAYRLHSQHLDARLPDGGLWTAAGTCGVQDTPAGSARVALRARVHLSAGDLDRAFSDRELVVLWSVRGAPNAVPVSDIEVFTTGALPADEESFRVFLQGQAGEVGQRGWLASSGIRSAVPIAQAAFPQPGRGGPYATACSVSGFS